MNITKEEYRFYLMQYSTHAGLVFITFFVGVIPGGLIGIFYHLPEWVTVFIFIPLSWAITVCVVIFLLDKRERRFQKEHNISNQRSDEVYKYYNQYYVCGYRFGDGDYRE